MTKDVYLVTGECAPRTNASTRLFMADLAQAEGRPMVALEYRAIVARMVREWEDPREHVRAKLVGRRPLMDPNEAVPPPGTPEHPMFWHEPEGATSPICGCGHFADYLCDEPIGKGRTCDAPACDCCRNQVGADLDQCDFHARTQPREPRA